MMRSFYKIDQINNALKSAELGFSGKFKCNFCNLEYASPSEEDMSEKRTY